MNEAAETQQMTKKQKTALLVLLMVAVCLIITGVLVFWVLPSFMRSRFQLKYQDKIKTYSEEYDLEPSLVAGVIYTESKFREDAKSRVGARGLMQIMPETGREIAEALGEPYDVDNLFDPETSIRYGCFYLRQQLDRFDQNVAVTLAAYNAGPNKAALWVSEYGLDENGRIRYIPYEETRNYVVRVLQAQENYESLYPEAFPKRTVD